ncbi:hypothetical protein [Burkholderia contaminans]|uniref:hypothetical protein n=1 Tax=Burkholderia contaminans TaxID=488447 RepID=UPI00158AD0BE|nr:hypothetical protein [Burkholderia contaminans]
MAEENRPIERLKFKRVITDINEDLIKALSKEETTFYNTLEGQKKDRFLYMSKADRQLLMNGGLSKKEEDAMWEYASTLSLHYINKPFIMGKYIDNLTKWGAIALTIAVSCFATDWFFNTYARNRQLHLEATTGKPVYELIPASLPRINNNKQNVNNSGGLMNVEQYKSYISQPKFQCDALGSITDSFYQPSGKPLCKKTEDGDVYVVGYVVNPTFPQPTFNVIHEGKIYNFDMNNDAAFTTAELPGLSRVTFNQVPYSFQKAFPDVVREATTSVVTKDAESK